MAIELLLGFIAIVTLSIFFIKFLNFDSNSSVYNERGARIGVEVFSNTLFYLLFLWSVVFIIKLMGFKHLDFIVKRKYS
ncbi:hypothetical protein KFV08_08100 [Macrococcoides canis]|uniref:hypothetical protein n=1 Tax=Macrococcoides canis TaxID=1855823 RepID=UPI00207D5791|nr:hypothetical protein [Macrococcus canis]MCO4095779.1 hypothetical protein [Macrococcus canis]UTH08485.1 hypothetical protein KFV08_08100 [Macrococcus canis]